MSETDLIERQAAIDAIEEVDWFHQNRNKDMVSGANPSEHQAWYKADDIYKTLEALPSAQPEPPTDDCISRKAAITLPVMPKEHREYQTINLDDAYEQGWNDLQKCIESLPSAQPTLYGYEIEHLAYIARVMQKEGVTAEYAARTFDDMSRALRMIIEETQERIEKSLSEMPWMSEV